MTFRTLPLLLLCTSAAVLTSGCGSNPSSTSTSGTGGFTIPATVAPPVGIYVPKSFDNNSGSILSVPVHYSGAVTPTTYVSDTVGDIFDLCTDKAGDLFAIEVQTSGTNTTENIVEFYSPNPATVVRRIETTSANAPDTIAVDPSGNIVSAGTGEISFYGPSDNGSAIPERVISGNLTLLGDELSVTFDSKGAMYVLNQPSGQPLNLLVFAPGASGNVAPTVVFTNFPSNFDPEFVSLDDSDNIYITSTQVQMNSSGQLIGFVPSIAMYAPGLTATSQATNELRPSLEYAFGELAFDSSRNIYISAADAAGNGYIVEFAAGSSGTANPTAVVSSPSFAGPDGTIVVR